MTAACIVQCLVEDDIDPKEEVRRQLDWKSILAHMGFVPTKCADYCDAMKRMFKGGEYMLIVLGEKKDLQGKVEVQYYSRGEDRRFVCAARQNVTPEFLEPLIRNYFRWLLVD